MEVAPGVFVSDVSTDSWELDPEVGGEMHVLCSADGVEAGLSRFTQPGAVVNWTLPQRETILVLEGEATIEIAGGPTLQLKVGSMASMPKGAVTTWHFSTPYKELWVLA